jgi:hypothetical protein
MPAVAAAGADVFTREDMSRMFPKSYSAMVPKSAEPATSGTPTPPTAAEAAEWREASAQWESAVQKDPALAGEFRQAMLRAGKEVHAARSVGGATTRAAQLRQMFPNSPSMFQEGGGR